MALVWTSMYSLALALLVGCDLIAAANENLRGAGFASSSSASFAAAGGNEHDRSLALSNECCEYGPDCPGKKSFLALSRECCVCDDFCGPGRDLVHYIEWWGTYNWRFECEVKTCGWPSDWECSDSIAFKNWMENPEDIRRSLCPAACGQDLPPVDQPVNPPEDPPYPIDCADKHKNCRGWEGRNECVTNSLVGTV